MEKHAILGEARDLSDEEAALGEGERSEEVDAVDLASLKAIDVRADGTGHADDLRAAIAAAPAGATITVHGGSWPGPFHIDKDLSIVGVDGARLRPELPAEIGKRLVDLHGRVDEALAFYKTWAMPGAILKQLKKNVTFNPLKKRRMAALQKVIDSDEHEAAWATQLAPLVELEAALYDEFVVVDGCSLTLKGLQLGFDEAELAFFESEAAETAVPAGMRRDRRKIATFDREKGAMTPFVSWAEASAWLDENGFGPKDLHATADQHRYREERLGLDKGATVTGDEHWERGWWEDHGGLLPDVCRSIPKQHRWADSDHLDVVSALRNGRRPTLDRAMIVFRGTGASHGLILEDCAVQGHELYPVGVHATSSTAEARLVLEGCTVEGIRSDHEYKETDSVWACVNAAIYAEWPTCGRKEPPVRLQKCTVRGGFIGLDVAGGAAEVLDCTLADNTCAGVRAFGSSEEPERAFARVKKSSLKRQEMAGVFGFRMDDKTLNLVTADLSFEGMGKWEVGALRSSEHRAEQKRQAQLVKERKEDAERRAKQEAERTRQAEVRRKAEAEAAAKARAEQATKAMAAAQAAAKARIEAVQSTGPTPHPSHPNVIVHPGGKIKPASGYTWRSQQAGDFRVIPKPQASPKAAAQPAGHRRVQSVRGCDIGCEDPECGGRIRGKLYFWAGKKFPDGWARGWFCSLGCLNRCEPVEHYGMPHKDFLAGDVVAALPDKHDCLTMMDDRYCEAEIRNNTRVAVVSNQYIARGEQYGTDAGEFDDFYAMTVRYQGHDYPNQWVGSFYLVKRG